MFIFRIGSGERCSKCSLRCIGGGICEGSILRVVAGSDPFLDYSVRADAAIQSRKTYQFIDVPAAILTSLGRVG